MTTPAQNLMGKTTCFQNFSVLLSIFLEFISYFLCVLTDYTEKLKNGANIRGYKKVHAEKDRTSQIYY